LNIAKGGQDGTPCAAAWISSRPASSGIQSIKSESRSRDDAPLPVPESRNVFWPIRQYNETDIFTSTLQQPRTGLITTNLRHFYYPDTFLYCPDVLWILPFFGSADPTRAAADKYLLPFKQ
jgi:hypothetical protein